jgi:hypothetical protein
LFELDSFERNSSGILQKFSGFIWWFSESKRIPQKLKMEEIRN